MADSSILIAIDTVDTLNRVHAGAKGPALEELERFIAGLRAGLVRARGIDIWKGGAEPVAASGTITIAGADGGTYRATINGANVDVTGTNGDDDATASDLADAINASTDALVQYLVTASASAGVVTITAAQDGITGNTITLAATGTNATASGARLTGGAGHNVSKVSFTL